MSNEQPSGSGSWVVKQIDQAERYLSTIGTWGELGAARWFDTEHDAQAAAVTECPEGTAGAAFHIDVAAPPAP